VLAPDELRRNPDGASLSASQPARTIRVLDFMETSWMGGPAKNLIRFAHHASQSTQSRLRVNISVATFHRRNVPANNEFTAACEKAGLRVHRIEERSAFDPAIVSAIQRLIRDQNPDILQTHSVKSHFLLRLTGAYKHRPWIAFHHGYTWTDLKVLAYNQLDRWSLPASYKVVTVCRPFASALHRLGVAKDRIAIRHNTVDPFTPAGNEALAQLRQSLCIPPTTRVLLNVARLSREKGQAELIKAVALLRSVQPSRSLRLLIVGEGPERGRLERLAAVSGASECVTFVGHQSDVTPYYTLADMVVVPSYTEGSPNVVLEALAAGLPVVATAVGGIPEIISSSRAAVLVKKNDPISLACSIARLLDNESLRAELSRAALNLASSYSPQAYCDFMLSLYRDCLSRGGTARNGRSNRSAKPIQKTMIATE
jgi:glycosyltransferase involved in cell wall biosynthesis